MKLVSLPNWCLDCETEVTIVDGAAHCACGTVEDIRSKLGQPMIVPKIDEIIER